MTIPFSLIAEKIADVLMAGNYKVELYDDTGNLVYDKKDARKFFTNPGKHMISIHDDGDNTSHLKVSLSSPVDIKEFEDSIGKKLRAIASQIGDNMSYDVRTFGKELTPRDFAHETIGKGNQMSDVNVNEGFKKMTGTSRSSYQKVGECRLIVRHINRVNEDKFGARSRNIKAIYVETKDGERFRMAENSLHGARAMARHLSNSGTPFDTVGLKITGMVNEMASLRDMVKEARALRKDEHLSEDANGLVEQIRNRYIGIRETLRKMTGKIGYFTQTADLHESDRIDELEYDLTPVELTQVRKVARKKGLPTLQDPHDGAIDTPPSTDLRYTGSDKERMLRQAASDYHWAQHQVRIDPTVPEQAHTINNILQFDGFRKSAQYGEYMDKIGESDEFDESMIYELEYDSPDGSPESGMERYAFDIEMLNKLTGVQKVAYLMSEVLSPLPSGNDLIDKIKSKIEQMPDEVWNVWSRVSENLADNRPPQDDEEKEAFRQAVKLFSDAGYGPFFESIEMEGKNPWGKIKASDMEDRLIDRMVDKGGNAPALRKKRPKDKYDDMAKKRGLESVQEIDDATDEFTTSRKYHGEEPKKCKKCGEEHFGICPLYDSIQEAEAEGKITSTTQKYKYESNIPEFDRPTGGKKAHDTNHIITDLSRDNAESMHSENIVEKELPEYKILEAWFDDMVRVDFFNEQDDENIDEKSHKGKKKTENQKDKADSINEAFDKLNFSRNIKEFDGFLKEYNEKGILDQILSFVEEKSNLWKMIKERRPMTASSMASPMVGPEEQRLQDAFRELSVIVNDRAKSIEQAIQELSQDFEDPENIANQLHQMAREAGLEKNDFGSTFADDVLSPNEEIQRGKEENKAEEFYGRAQFSEVDDISNKDPKEQGDSKSINPEDLDFDTVYKNGQYYIQDKITKLVIATAGSGGQALNLLDRWNSPEGKIRAAEKFNDRIQSDTDYERHKQTDDYRQFEEIKEHIDHVHRARWLKQPEQSVKAESALSRMKELAGLKKKLNEAAPYNKALGRQAVGTWDRPGSPAMQRGANKAQRQADKREIGADVSDIDAVDTNQPDAQTDAPYAIIWHGQYRENYGAHNWDGQGEAPQHWKNKGDAGSVLAKNIPDWQTAEELLAQLSQEDRSQSDDYSETHASPPEIVSMSELGKHFHGYDPDMQEYGAKPEDDDDRDIIDMAVNQHEEHDVVHEDHDHDHDDCGCGEDCKCGGTCGGKCGDEKCPCECGERTGVGVNECSLSNVTMEEIEPDLTEDMTDQNLARIIQLAKYRNGLYTR